MSARPRRRNYLWESFQLAKRIDARVVQVQDLVDRAQPARAGNFALAWVVYWRGVRQGKRRNPAALLRLLEQLAGPT